MLVDVVECMEYRDVVVDDCADYCMYLLSLDVCCSFLFLFISY